MVEVKEPFIAEHAATQRVTARRPRRTAGGALSSLPFFALLKRQPYRAKLLPKSAYGGLGPGKLPPGRGEGSGRKGGEGPHTVAGSSRTTPPPPLAFSCGRELLAPWMGRGGRGNDFAANAAGNARRARLSQPGSALLGVGRET